VPILEDDYIQTLLKYSSQTQTFNITQPNCIEEESQHSPPGYALKGESFFISNILLESGKGGCIYSGNREKNCEINLWPIMLTNQTELSLTENFDASGPVL